MQMYKSIRDAVKIALVYTLIAAQTVLGIGGSELEQKIVDANIPIAPVKNVMPADSNSVGKNNPVEKYAVLCSGNSEKYEPGAKDRFWLALTDTYKSLIELGFKKENIHVLYPLPPNRELPRNQEISDYILSEENKNNVAWSSKENLNETIERTTKKTDNNDEFRLYFVGHGSYKNGKSLYNLLEKIGDGSSGAVQKLTNEELNKLIDNQKIGSGMIFFDICESGKWNIDHADYVTITTCGNEKQGAILSPDFSFSAKLTENENKKESDLNHDGKISLEEAFEKTKQQYREEIDKLLERGELSEKDRQFFPEPKLNLK